jgi:hypothetical protein
MAEGAEETEGEEMTAGVVVVRVPLAQSIRKMEDGSTMVST